MDARSNRIDQLRRMVAAWTQAKVDSEEARHYANAKLFAAEITKLQAELERLEAEDGAS